MALQEWDGGVHSRVRGTYLWTALPRICAELWSAQYEYGLPGKEEWMDEVYQRKKPRELGAMLFVGATLIAACAVLSPKARAPTVESTGHSTDATDQQIFLPIAVRSSTHLASTPTPIPTPTGTPVSWYKLRLRISTTSDWSWVELSGGARVLVGGIVEASGGFPQRGGNRVVGLTQPIDAAWRGEQVSMTADFALTDLSARVQFEITRGDLGETTVEVWNANSTVPTAIRTVRWSGRDSPSNPFPFTVEASAITSGGPLSSRPDDIADAEFSLSRTLDNQLPDLPPQFYRACITFTTTSDWANLSLARGAEVFDACLLNTVGNPTRAEVNRTEFMLSQPLQQANAGSTVGMAAGVLFSDMASGNPIDFVISKGHLNSATIELSNYNGSAPVPITRVVHSGISSYTDPRNPVTFTVDSALLTANGPLEVRRPATSKMIWAFYYPWYQMGDWTSSYLRDRPATPYASSDREALSRHVEQAKAAGIDGFVVSWWGPGSYTDQNFAQLLDIAAQHGFWLVPYFETLNQPNAARPEQEIRQWLEYLIPKYGRHSAYYCLNSKPVVVIWASGAVPLSTWQRILSELRSKGLDALYLAMGLSDTDALSVFDGLHDYGVAGVFRLGMSYQYVARHVRGYSLVHTDEQPKVFAATLQPGYDDRSLPDREGMYWDRRNGDSYQYTFEAAMKSDPDWLFITTWNEWWEHTYIEPSEEYGDLYLRLTREFADKWKR